MHFQIISVVLRNNGAVLRIISVISQNHDDDSQNHTVNRRNHTDDLEMDAFLCIFVSSEKQVFI